METTIEQLSDYELEPQRRTGGKPIPTTLHSIIQSNLVFEFRLHYPQQYRALSELTLDTPPNGATPDVVVYPYFKADSTKEYPARRTDAPLITVEIQSPSQSLDEMLDKADVYFAFGVKSCWIVQPRIEGIFVYGEPNRYQFFHHDDVLRDPNFDIEISLSEVFK